MTPVSISLCNTQKKIPQFKKNCGKKMTSALRNTVKGYYENIAKFQKPKQNQTKE